jgi:hypothetical protein
MECIYSVIYERYEMYPRSCADVVVRVMPEWRTRIGRGRASGTCLLGHHRRNEHTIAQLSWCVFACMFRSPFLSAREHAHHSRYRTRRACVCACKRSHMYACKRQHMCADAQRSIENRDARAGIKKESHDRAHRLATRPPFARTCGGITLFCVYVCS